MRKLVIAYVNNKGVDQHPHPHSLVRLLLFCILDKMESLVPIFEVQFSSLSL